MGRYKGGTNKVYTTEEKLEIVKKMIKLNLSQPQASKEFNINQSILGRWRKDYLEKGISGLTVKRKPGNPISRYSTKKKLTHLEKLEYENMKLRIENERLKKGYMMKGDGTVVIFKKLNKENLK